MLLSKLETILSFYDTELRRLGATSSECSMSLSKPTREQVLNHCRWMIARIHSFATSDKFDKAMRWLGFVQGALWALGVYTIDEMRDHNR